MTKFNSTVCVLLCALCAAQAEVVVISDDFSTSTITDQTRIRINQVGDGWSKRDVSLWTTSSGNLANAGTTAGVPSEGVVGQVVSTSGIASTNTALKVSFDYTVGAGSTLFFHLIGLTTNGAPAANEILANTGTSGGNIQASKTEIDFGNLDLIDGTDVTDTPEDTVSFAAGSSGTYTKYINLTNYSWTADEAPGLTGSISNVTSFENILTAFAADMTLSNGAGAISIDNLELSAISAGEVPEIPRPAQPNFVMLYADDLGWQDVGCYDVDTNAVFDTPYMDELATEGVKFWEAYSPAPVCAPSRAGILTGKHPARVKLTSVKGGTCPQPLNDNRMMDPYDNKRLELSWETLPEILGPEGYINGHIGKWHLKGEGSAPDPFAQGFDYSEQDRGATIVLGDRTTDFSTGTNLDVNGFAYDQTTENALTFLDQAVATNKPFFCYFATYLVHGPIHIRTESLLQKYAARMGYSYPLDGSEFFAPGQNNPYYAAMVETMDYSYHRVVTYLKETDDPRWPGHKLIENTYVIFTSDNGGMEKPSDHVTDNFPLDEGKIHAEEGGTRVPFIVVGPDIATNIESDVMVNGLDLFPTILSLAGIPIPDELDGRDISTLLLDDPQDRLLVTNDVEEVRDTMHWHYPHGGRLYTTIRKEGWKLFKNYDHLDNVDRNPYRLYQLYDTNGIPVDIGETNDLYSVETNKLAELAADMEAWMVEVDASVPHYNPNYSGTLSNKSLVPTVITNGNSEGVVSVQYTTNDAAVVEVILLYTLTGGTGAEEWFQAPATITSPGHAEAVVPAGTTHYVFNLIDENNFLISYPDVGTLNDGDADSVYAFPYVFIAYVDLGPQDTFFSEDFSSATLGTNLLRDDVGFQIGSSSEWMIDGGMLSNTSQINSSVSEGAAAFILDLSTLPSNTIDRFTLSFDWTMAEANETLFVHVWGYVDHTSTPTTAIMNHGASNGSAWENADPDYMTVYNFGNLDGVFNGTEGIADDAAISFTGAFATTNYTRTFDLSAWTTASNTLNAYDYLAVGFARKVSGATPAATIDNVLITVPTSDGYRQWEFDENLTEDTETGDPDGDRILNLMEYALGGNPNLDADDAVLPSAAIVTNGGFQGLEYVYRRRYADTNLIYTVQSTTNLVSATWSTNGVIETGAAMIDAEFESVTNRIDAGDITFGRLKVER